MTLAVISGSFDPPTFGHLNLLQRTLNIFDEVVIAIGINATKKPMFSTAERQQLLAELVASELPESQSRINIVTTQKLLAEFAKEVNANAIVRGVRSIGEYEAEQTMALLNQKLTGIETVLLIAEPSLGFVSSSAVKEIAGFGGSVAGLVPPLVAQAIIDAKER